MQPELYGLERCGPERYGDEQRMLAAIIAEALHIADALELSTIGISLNAALERLTGHGVAPEAFDTSVH